MLIVCSQIFSTGVGLYLEAAMINHSCQPTSVQTFVNEKLHIRSITDIPKGGEITISYIDVARPTTYRRKLLFKTYGFRCQCILCSISCEEDYWLHSNCKGHLKQTFESSASQFMNWKQGQFSQDLTTDFQESIPLPLRREMVCSYCSQLVTKTTLDEYAREIIIACDMLRYVSDGSEKIKALINAHQTILKYVSERSYARYEVLSSLCVYLISMGMFREALPFSENLCTLAQHLYPDSHPQVSIFNLQHAKLLRYVCGDSNAETSRFFEKAYSSLKHSHHSSHKIFAEFQFL